MRRFKELRLVAGLVVATGWLLLLAVALAVLMAMLAAGQIAFWILLPGALAGAAFGLMTVAHGRFLQCFISLSDHLQNIADNTARIPSTDHQEKR